MLDNKGKKDIEKYVDSLRLNEAVSPEEYRESLKKLMKDRAKFLYFVRQVLIEKYSVDEADEVIREASFRHGRVKGIECGDCKNASDVMKNWTSKEAMIVLKQEITELTEDQAVKIFHYCPMVEEFQDLGCSAEEVKHLCFDMMMHRDFGVVDPHPVEIEFKKVIAAGDPVCHLVVKTKK